MSKIFVLFILVIILSCAPKKVNQYINTKGTKVRQGFWTEQYDADGGKIQAKGKYEKGEKVGVWKMTLEGRNYQKDKIRGGIIKTKIYHPNGKIMERGQSRTDISSNERHWYYFGDWKYYDEAGRLIKIIKYADGKKIDSLTL